MTVWYKARAYRDRTLSWSGKTVLALGLLAVLLVAAAMPAALFVGVILMLFGHVVGGLALFGASILAAGAAVVIAGLGGVRHLRRLIGQQRDRFVQIERWRLPLRVMRGGSRRWSARPDSEKLALWGITRATRHGS